MVTTFLKSQLARVWSSRRRGHDNGFTLVELLIVTIIAGGIVSGLLFLVVELLTADQRDSSRNETQRDMQRALDYISSELRQAVYVYPGDCLGTAPVGTRGDPNYCPGLSNFLPTNVVSLANSSSQSVPILAFWRQKDLPPIVKGRCASAASLDAANPINTPNNSVISCATGNSYALVVYSISKANSSNIWNGNARITRYELPQFKYTTGDPSAGYALPIVNNKQIFRIWPYGSNEAAAVGTQNPGSPDGTLTVLTDFVDDGKGAEALALASGSPAPITSTCPDDPTTINDTTTPNFDEGLDYTISPATYSFQNSSIRSFYACVSNTPNIDNRNVILYIRGNASGRPGINTQKDFLATLSTQVLSRGILDKDPG
jgi:prepilin-type N-terminal cleavage/methylation domain-containing protein